MNIAEICQHTEKLGAIRSRGCQILCLASLMSAHGAEASDRGELQAMVAEYDVALRWLNNDLLPALEKTGHKVSHDMEKDIAHAAKQVAALVQRLRSIADDLGQPDLPVAIREAMAMQSNQLGPAYDTVMKGLEDARRATRQSGDDENRKVIDKALGELEQINSTINLIAVNASIEAARVGDQGRGFAVISTEIQELSKKSRSVVEGIKENLA